MLPAVPEWSHVESPRQPEVWEVALADHPDSAYRTYLVKGLHEGFRIGFGYGSTCQCTGASSNMHSAEERPSITTEFLASELRSGGVLGPIDPSSAVAIQVNRFGLVPKGHHPDKWRLIVDLSFPSGGSVNDGIDPALCSLHYTSVDEACRRVLALGRGAMLAKFDVQGAFRTVPVHPEDRWLLGMRWQGNTYVDKVLPFGLRSAPKIYSAVADGLLWILRAQDDVNSIHYLDDFLLFGAPDTPQCEVILSRALARCTCLGVPVAPDKTDGPSMVLVFLGIQLDTRSLTMSLPSSKLERLRTTIRMWMGKKSCSKRELLSIIGQLQHTCCVIRPGRAFLRCMIDPSKRVKELHHKVRLNAAFRSDLRWWGCFLPIWNGACSMAGAALRKPQVILTSDASGSWGCGAYTSTGEWFQLALMEDWNGVHITVKELVHTSDTSHLARKKDRHRIRCMARSILLLPEFIMATTAALSQRHCAVRPFHLGPHMATPSTIGSTHQGGG